jgi:arabinofuranosyltransferase
MTFPWLVFGVLGSATAAGLTARITRQYALAAIAGSAAILLLQSRFYLHYTSDDAYISYRYARNLADGAGLVWNPGQHVEGYSNYLWVVTLAGLHKAGADIVLSGRWLGFSIAIVGAGATYRLSRDLLDDQSGPIAGLVAALLLSASGSWALWAAGGLEVPLFGTLVIVAVLLHLREREWRWPPVSGAVWALVAMTRPDGILLAAVSSLFKVYDGVHAARGARAHSMRAVREFAWLLFFFATFAAIYGPYYLWRYDTYGWFFPNTYYAKVGYGIDQYDRGLRYFMLFLEESGGWLLLITPIAIAFAPMRRSRATYVFGLMIVWMAYVVYVGGDSLLRFRFFAPVLPLFFALVTASVAALVTAEHLEVNVSQRTKEVIAGLAVLGALAFVLYPSVSDSNGIKGERRAVNDRAAAGRWLYENVPPTTVVAAIPVGAIAYESRLDVVDMLGINDEHIAHRDVPLGDFAAGHEKYDSEYVLDQEPDIIILFDGLSNQPVSQGDYARLNNVFIPALIDMLNSDRLKREYTPRTVEIREGKWLNVFVRRESPALLARTQPAPP